MFHNKLVWALALASLAGCQFPVRQQIDSMVCKDVTLDLAPSPSKKAAPTEPAPTHNASPLSRGDRDIDASSGLLLTSAQGQEQPQRPTMLSVLLEKVQPGSNVPGSEAPDITLQPPGPGQKKDLEAYKKAAQEAARLHFKKLPTLAPEFKPARGPNGVPLTLSDLQRLARANSPLLRQAAANIEAARGAAVQAGLYPNPTVGLNGVGQGPGGGPNYGTAITQSIITMGKLSLNQAAFVEDLKMAQIAYRRAEADLAYNVRTGYFSVLVAQESIRANRALAMLTDEVYDVMVRQFANGGSAMYEPMQLGVFAYQARASLIQARNTYTLAWKNLASTLGLPGMPATEVAGRVAELKMPLYKHEEVLAHVLKNHTDAQTAEENILKARYNLRYAQVQPIPDVNASLGTYYDNTQGAGPYRMVGTFNLGIAIPVWNMNQGAIRQQQGVLVQMNEEPHRVRAALTASVADAFKRYDESRDLLRIYHESILPRQVQAFRGTLKRYNAVVGEVAYWDVINSEQNLVTVIGNYIPILGNMWQSVADVANLLQTDDIFQVTSSNVEPVTMIDLEKMIQCCHPCSTMQDPAYKAMDPSWHRGGTDIMAPSPELRMELPEPKQTSPHHMELPNIDPALFGPPQTQRPTGGADPMGAMAGYQQQQIAATPMLENAALEQPGTPPQSNGVPLVTFGNPVVEHPR